MNEMLLSDSFVGLFLKRHINLRGLFKAKAIPVEVQQWYHSTHSYRNKGVHTFSKGICPKVNIIARLQFDWIPKVLTSMSQSKTLATTPQKLPIDFWAVIKFFQSISGYIKKNRHRVAPILRLPSRLGL